MSSYMSIGPTRSLATRPKARLSTFIQPMLLAACTTRKADHVEKRDPRSDGNDARLEKRT